MKMGCPTSEVRKPYSPVSGRQSMTRGKTKAAFITATQTIRTTDLVWEHFREYDFVRATRVSDDRRPALDEWEITVCVPRNLAFRLFQ